MFWHISSAKGTDLITSCILHIGISSSSIHQRSRNPKSFQEYFPTWSETLDLSQSKESQISSQIPPSKWKNHTRFPSLHTISYCWPFTLWCIVFHTCITVLLLVQLFEQTNLSRACSSNSGFTPYSRSRYTLHQNQSFSVTVGVAVESGGILSGLISTWVVFPFFSF